MNLRVITRLLANDPCNIQKSAAFFCFPPVVPPYRRYNIGWYLVKQVIQAPVECLNSFPHHRLSLTCVPVIGSVGDSDQVGPGQIFEVSENVWIMGNIANSLIQGCDTEQACQLGDIAE